MHILRFFSTTGEEIWKVEAPSIQAYSITQEKKIFYINNSDGQSPKKITIFGPGILTLEEPKM